MLFYGSRIPVKAESPHEPSVYRGTENANYDDITSGSQFGAVLHIYRV